MSEEFLDSVPRELALEPANLPRVIQQHRRVWHAIKNRDPQGVHDERQAQLTWVPHQWPMIQNASRTRPSKGSG